MLCPGVYDLSLPLGGFWATASDDEERDSAVFRCHDLKVCPGDVRGGSSSRVRSSLAVRPRWTWRQHTTALWPLASTYARHVEHRCSGHFRGRSVELVLLRLRLKHLHPLCLQAHHISGIGPDDVCHISSLLFWYSRVLF